MEGKVKFFNRVKGFGFITGDDGQDYFVHHTSLAKGTFIREGDVVSFDSGQGDRGLKADNVALLKKASELPGGAGEGQDSRKSSGDDSDESQESGDSEEEASDDEDKEE